MWEECDFKCSAKTLSDIELRASDLSASTLSSNPYIQIRLYTFSTSMSLWCFTAVIH